MNNVILSGVVGSTAYGLAGPDSDQDRLGIFVTDTKNVLGLQGAQMVQETKAHTDPDETYHEVGKYLSLALKSNPTVLELLWLPEYEVETLAGTALVMNRSYFLSETYVRNAYGGYAKQQADRLMRRNDEGKEGFSSNVKKRTAKHARHCMRLLLQGEQLLRTGSMTVDVSLHRDWLFNWGDVAVKDPVTFYGCFEREFDQFNRTESVLAEKPDVEKINSFLVRLRREALYPSASGWLV